MGCEKQVHSTGGCVSISCGCGCCRRCWLAHGTDQICRHALLAVAVLVQHVVCAVPACLRDLAAVPLRVAAETCLHLGADSEIVVGYRRRGRLELWSWRRRRLPCLRAAVLPP